MELFGRLTDDIRQLTRDLYVEKNKNEILKEANFELKLDNMRLTDCKHEKSPREPSALFTTNEKKTDKNTNESSVSAVENNGNHHEGPTVIEENIVSENRNKSSNNQPNKRKRPSKKRRNRNKNELLNSSTQERQTSSAAEAISEIQVSLTANNNNNSSSISSSTNHSNDDNNRSSNQKVDNTNSSRSTVIIGDSLLKNVHGWELKKRCDKGEKIYVKCFPGANTHDLTSYVIPSTERSPDCIILHVGTNDLRSEKSEVEIAREITDLATSISERSIEVRISELVPRGDALESKRNKVNISLKELCKQHKFSFIGQSNITPHSHLNNSKIHLNKVGDTIFAENLFKGSRTVPH